MKPKFNLETPIQDIFNDTKFNEIIQSELTGFEKKINELKRPKGGVKQFIEKFSIDEIKVQYIRIANKKAYLTAIQRKIIVHLVSASLIKTIQFYQLENQTV